MVENNLLALLAWLAELILASYFLSHGSEFLARRYGARFVGRSLLSVATTLPEIAIVVYAASNGSYGTAIGAGLGSNMLMMTLGVALMTIVATTKLSKAPMKGIDVSPFKLDKIFLFITAIVGSVLFIDGYNLIDGLVFAGFFAAYIIMAYKDMQAESRMTEKLAAASTPYQASSIRFEASSPPKSRIPTMAIITFLGGTIGIFLGAGPFVNSLQGLALDSGISVIVLAVVISPIAGEMPEKISMILLARKGATGASIAVANVLGSKILNNTLLLAVAVFAAIYHGGIAAVIENTPTLRFQVILVTAVTLVALALMTRKEIGLRTGVILAAIYIISIAIQFMIPQDLKLR